MISRRSMILLAPIGLELDLALGLGCGSGVAPFTPSNVAGLALWLDGRQTGFADTSTTTPVTAPSGRVRRIDQPAPLAGSLLAPSDPKRPFREANSLDFHIGAGLNTVFPNAAMNAASVTVACSFVLRGDTNWDTLFSGTCGPEPSFWGVNVMGGKLSFINRNVGGNPTTFIETDTTISIKVGSRVEFVSRHSATGIDIWARVDGVEFTQTLPLTIAATAITGVTIGVRPDIPNQLQFHGAVAQLVIYSAVISDADRDQLKTFLKANRPDVFPLDTPLIAYMGDSIVRGATVVSGFAATWVTLSQLYTSMPTPRLLNAGVDGRGVSQVVAGYPTEVKPFFSASRALNIAVVAVGTNDLQAGADPTALAASFLAFCDTLRADGWRVMVRPVLPRSNAGIVADFEARRQTFNAALIAGSAHYDAYSDVVAIPGMGAFGDSDNATNYTDKIHPTAVGYALIAPVDAAAIRNLLGVHAAMAATVTSPTASFAGSITGGGSNTYLPGYPEFFGWTNPDYTASITRRQFVANILT